MNSEQERMKTKPIFSLLVSMALPMMFSMLIQSLYNIIDSIFVAKMGNDALAAVSFIFPLQNLVLSVAVGFGVGISSCVAIAMGANDKERAERAAAHGIIFSIIHSVLFVFLGLFITEPFLRLFTKNVDVIRMGSDYGRIVLCFGFGCIIQVAIEKIYQALGNMKITMYVLGAGALINIILDPIFIFGYFGIPKMGVAGAAVATVIGQISGMFMYVFYYLKSKHQTPIKISIKHFHFNGSVTKQLYSIGIPSSIMFALPSILISILNSILKGFSETHVSVLGLYYKLQTFIYLPTNGIVQGMRPIISFNYGAKEKERVKKTLHISILFASVIMLLGTVLSLCIPSQILSMFNNNKDILNIGVDALRIISLGFIISAYGVIYSGAFEALGMGMQSLIVSLSRQLVIIVPLAILLSKFLGATGIWIAFPVSELIASVIAILLMKITLHQI